MLKKVKTIKSFKPDNYTAPKAVGFMGDGHKEIGIEEPKWPSLEEQFSWCNDIRAMKIANAFNWYNATQDSKKSFEWALSALHSNKNRNELVKILKNSIWTPGLKVTGWLMRMASMGMELRWHERKFIAKQFRLALSQKSNIIEDIEIKNQPNIQDRIRRKLKQVIGVLDEEFDNFMSDKEMPNFDLILNELQPNPNRIRDLVAVINDQFLNELVEAQSGKNSDLTEAYSHYKLRDMKLMIAFWNSAISAINSYGVSKKSSRKANKTRKRKEVPPSKIVSKLKFLKTEPKLKLTSVDPTQILRSSEMYVYNVKTRKIGMFVTDPHASCLDVKGSKILNFDMSASVQKTLRHPEKQLAEFTVLGKTASRKWFKNIKSIETKLRAGLNANTILLKISK